MVSSIPAGQVWFQIFHPNFDSVSLESHEAYGQQSALVTAFQMGFDCHSLGRTAWNI